MIVYEQNFHYYMYVYDVIHVNILKLPNSLIPNTHLHVYHGR